MKPSQFVYHAPRTLSEAVTMLAEVAPQDGRVLAGGQSLIPAMALRLAQPAHLVDINDVAGLDRLAIESGALCIGACVRHTAFERPVEEGPLGRILATVVRYIGHYPIRTRGTFCGSIANADPASEWSLVAATLGATMVVRSTRGSRTIEAAGFFKGLMTTAIAPDEMLTEVRVPLLQAPTRCGFYEFSRRAGDFALAMALATWRPDRDVMKDVRLGVGGAEANPRRIAEAERLLEGKPASPQAFAAAADAVAKAVAPLDDIRYPREYRRDVVRAMARRALEDASR
jgi:carbon-monoxide dehydrogenase medium subunit